jgi:trans-aconitate methyltransferase
MKLEVAKKLIEEGIEQTDGRQIWVDLGAGNGLFTYALSTLLSDTSVIYSVDTDAHSLSAINIRKPVTLKKIQADFEKEDWGPEMVTGVLMANALHYVKDKESLLKKIGDRMMSGGRLIIVEYEMEKANNWVPYPIGFDRLGELVFRTDYKSIRKLSEVPSVYEHRMIYSVLVRA